MKWNASHTEIVCMLRESAACLPLQDKAYRTEKKAKHIEVERHLYLESWEFISYFTIILPFFSFFFVIFLILHDTCLNAIAPKGNYIVVCIYINVSIFFCIIWEKMRKCTYVWYEKTDTRRKYGRAAYFWSFLFTAVYHMFRHHRSIVNWCVI